MPDKFGYKTFEEQFKEISEKYRGIRREDLDEINPWYSCIICKEGPNCGHSCTIPDLITEEEFALRYSFDY